MLLSPLVVLLSLLVVGVEEADLESLMVVVAEVEVGYSLDIQEADVSRYQAVFHVPLYYFAHWQN